MRLIDADALEYRSPFMGEGVPFLIKDDIDAAPTVTPEIHVRYDAVHDTWVNSEPIRLFADTDGFIDYPLKMVIET